VGLFFNPGHQTGKGVGDEKEADEERGGKERKEHLQVG
jgi:hypothetical protein